MSFDLSTLELVGKGKNASVYQHPETSWVIKEASETEYLHLQGCNKVNSLMVKAIGFSNGQLVMEKLERVSLDAFSHSERRAMLDLFIKQVKELNLFGYAHRDIKRHPNQSTMATRWDNVVLTHEGIRLIDAGHMVCETEVSEYTFKDGVSDDFWAVQDFIEYFCEGYPTSEDSFSEWLSKEEESSEVTETKSVVVAGTVTTIERNGVTYVTYQVADDGGFATLVIDGDSITTWADHRPDTAEDAVSYIVENLSSQCNIQFPASWEMGHVTTFFINQLAKLVKAEGKVVVKTAKKTFSLQRPESKSTPRVDSNVLANGPWNRSRR